MSTEVRRHRGAYWEVADSSKVTKKRMLEELKGRKYAVKYAIDKREAAMHYERQQRDLLSYHPFTKAELRRFAIDRGLMVPSDKQVGRAEVIAMLTNADDHPTFHVFLKLPGELRIRIYEHYNEGFSAQPDCLSRPPLAFVSKEVQKEFLPVFYQCTTFQLRFVRTPPYLHMEYDDRVHYEPEPRTFVLLTDLNQKTAFDLRKLRVVLSQVKAWQPSPIESTAAFTLEARARGGQPRYCIIIEEGSRQDVKLLLEAALSRFLNSKTAISVGTGFSMASIDAVCDIVRRMKP